MRGKWIIFLAIFMLLAVAVYALETGETDNIELKVKPLNGSIIGTGIASYDITITNKFSFSDHFMLSFSDDVEWVIQTDPISYKLTGFDLGPGESKTFRTTLMANPAVNLAHRQYSIEIKAKSNTANLWNKDMIVIGYGPQFVKGVEYPVSVDLGVEIPSKIDPRQDVEIRVYLRNRFPSYITNLDVYLSSSLIKVHNVTALGPATLPEGSITQLYLVRLDRLTIPQKDTLIVNVAYNDEPVATKSKNFEIVSYSQFEEQKTESKDTFYKTTITLKYRNNGNYEKTEQIKYPVTISQRLFSHTTPKSKPLAEKGRGYVAWDLKLQPNETKELKVVIDYLPLLIVVVLLLALLIGFRLAKSPVTISKHSQLLAKREGGIAGLKVLLTVKNWSNKPVHDVEVVDSVPNIVDIDKNFEMGHIAPTRIVDHGHRGILIKWKLGELEPGEERILSYKASSRLTILGSFTLPAAVTRFILNYKEKVVHSNRVRIEL